MCTATGPGSASLAAAWAAQHNLTNVMVWGDTQDYMFNTFLSGAPINGGYPSTMVIDLDTMELTYLQAAQMAQAESAIDAILAADHPCAEY